MKLGFLPRLQYDIFSGAVSSASSVSPLAAPLAILQGGLGIVQSITGAAKQKRLLNQRKAFETPNAVFDILQATQNRSQNGYDPVTLDYLTNQNNQAFADAAGATLRLDGDPNNIAALFQQRVQNAMRIGAENHALNTENFNRYLAAQDAVAKNQEAEWASRENILKDKIQAAGANVQQGLQNVNNAANSLIAIDSANRTANLPNQNNGVAPAFSSGDQEILGQLKMILPYIRPRG